MPGSLKLTRLQGELLLALYNAQREFITGQWSSDSTLWSKVSYRVARAHKKLRPSPVPGMHNMERAFEQRLKRAAKRLVSLDLATWRNVKPPEAPSRIVQGYKRHKSHGKDLFLTPSGLDTTEARLRQSALMPLPGMASCTGALEPAGPVAKGVGGCDD